MLMSGCCVPTFPRFCLVSLGEFVCGASRDAAESASRSVKRSRESEPSAGLQTGRPVSASAAAGPNRDERPEEAGEAVRTEGLVDGAGAGRWRADKSGDSGRPGAPPRGAGAQSERPPQPGFRKSVRFCCIVATELSAQWALNRVNLICRPANAFLSARASRCLSGHRTPGCLLRSAAPGRPRAKSRSPLLRAPLRTRRRVQSCLLESKSSHVALFRSQQRADTRRNTPLLCKTSFHCSLVLSWSLPVLHCC